MEELPLNRTEDLLVRNNSHLKKNNLQNDYKIMIYKIITVQEYLRI